MAAAAAQGDDGNAAPIAELITTYHELNSSLIEELSEEPSPLEFMRYVARNTPFVVRGGARDWQATKTWDVQYLTHFLRDHQVNVAVTPLGLVVIFLCSERKEEENVEELVPDDSAQ